MLAASMQLCLGVQQQACMFADMHPAGCKAVGMLQRILPGMFDCRSCCVQCIYAWLERKNTCPLCESPMDLQDDILL